MITITVKGLANFMMATHARQRKIVYDFKYPKADESAAQQMYYKEARQFISAYHSHGHTAPWLLQKAHTLELLATQHPGQTGTRLNHNARALRFYHEHFSSKHFEVLGRRTFSFETGSARVKVTPDLHVFENQREKIIKLEFGSAEPDAKMVKIIGQVMYESANCNGSILPCASVLYYDVPRGAIHKGARARTRMRGEINAACQTISDIWHTI